MRKKDLTDLADDYIEDEYQADEEMDDYIYDINEHL